MVTDVGTLSTNRKCSGVHLDFIVLILIIQQWVLMMDLINIKIKYQIHQYHEKGYYCENNPIPTSSELVEEFSNENMKEEKIKNIENFYLYQILIIQLVNGSKVNVLLEITVSLNN